MCCAQYPHLSPVSVSCCEKQWEWNRGVFQLESCEEFLGYSRNHFAIIPCKVGVSIRPFRSLARAFPNRLLIFYITPSWELRSGNKTYDGSHFFVKMWSEHDFDYFQLKDPPTTWARLWLLITLDWLSDLFGRFGRTGIPPQPNRKYW